MIGGNYFIYFNMNAYEKIEPIHAPSKFLNVHL